MPAYTAATQTLDKHMLPPGKNLVEGYDGEFGRDNSNK